MNWAWQQPLSPALKLILMALADAADDGGISWPSVSTIAVKCNLSTRTVRRGIQALIVSGLLVSEPRYRRDGSCASNRYRLQLSGGDKLSLAPVRADRPPGQGRQGPPDTGVIPRTTTGTQIESPPPRVTATEIIGSGSGATGGGD
ncbi:MAG: helix-turn-helix domain-containing protein [Planctomycetota bacterium]